MSEEEVKTEILPETTKADLVQLREKDWYKYWIEELGAEFTEKNFHIQQLKIDMWYSIGKQIVEKFPDFEREKIYGQSIMKVVIEDLHKNRTDVYAAVKMARMNPTEADFEKWKESLPDGKATNWTKAKQTSLKEPPKEGEQAKPQKPDKPVVTWVFVNDKWQIHMTEDAIMNTDWSQIKDTLIDFFKTPEA